jgi:hypothetical protein
LAIARDGVEIGPFDDNLKVGRHRSFDRESVAGVETALGGKGLRDELVLELNGAVPRVAAHAVLLPGELVRGIEVLVFSGLAAGGDIHAIKRQDIGFEAAHLEWSGSEDNAFTVHHHRRRWRRGGREKREKP